MRKFLIPLALLSLSAPVLAETPAKPAAAAKVADLCQALADNE